jgi:hypothetical protein
MVDGRGICNESFDQHPEDLNTETIFKTSLPSGFYSGRIMAFVFVPIGAFFCYAYQFPIAVPVGLFLFACMASQNQNEFILKLDADHLHVILPSFYGKTFSTINTYERSEIREITLSEWERHINGNKSKYSVTVSDLTGASRNRTYAELQIIVEDKVIQETARYTFRISTYAQSLIDTSGRKAMFTDFVSEAENQIREHSKHR